MGTNEVESFWGKKEKKEAVGYRGTGLGGVNLGGHVL